MLLEALAVALAAISPNPPACGCARRRPVCTEYWQAPIVFLGRAIDSRVLSAGTDERGVDHRFWYTRFSVLERFRGGAETDATVKTAGPKDSCEMRFDAGGVYLVYATREGNALAAATCGRTHAIQGDWRDDVDVKWIRGIPDAPRGGTIFGSILSAKTPMPRIKVRVRGPIEAEALTDDKGNYSIDRLVPGSYAVRADIPGRYSRKDMQEADVQDRSCAEVDFDIAPTAP